PLVNFRLKLPRHRIRLSANISEIEVRQLNIFRLGCFCDYLRHSSNVINSAVKSLQQTFDHHESDFLLHNARRRFNTEQALSTFYSAIHDAGYRTNGIRCHLFDSANKPIYQIHSDMTHSSNDFPGSGSYLISDCHIRIYYRAE